MGKIINITDKLSSGKPSIQVGETLYEVNDSMEVVLRFEELANAETLEAMVDAIGLTIGEAAVDALNVRKMSISNFKVLMTAILAAAQGVDYDTAAARFQGI